MPSIMASRIREYFSTTYRPGERLLVQKIDFFILTFCCVSYFINYVSSCAVGRLFVSHSC
jgi:MFS transporter, ACS family, pantothenate transporter